MWDREWDKEWEREWDREWEGDRSAIESGIETANLCVTEAIRHLRRARKGKGRRRRGSWRRERSLKSVRLSVGVFKTSLTNLFACEKPPLLLLTMTTQCSRRATAWSPTLYPCSPRGATKVARRKGEAERDSQAGVSRHAGTKTAKDSALGSGAARSSPLTCSAIRCMTPSTHGGLAWYDAEVGKKSKKEPTEPKGASTSGNALQKVSYRQLSGDAKH